MDLIDVILILGPLVVVPLARPLLARDWFPPLWVVAAAAVLFATAFAFDVTGWPAVLTVPWFGVALYALVRAALDILRRRAFAPLDLALLVPYGYLVVSANWAFLTRAGRTLVGIDEPIVELTGVHFLYAGFATMVLALSVAGVERVPRAVAYFALACGVVGPVLVASGFSFEQGVFQARIHGTLNAIGFVGCGLIGWRNLQQP